MKKAFKSALELKVKSANLILNDKAIIKAMDRLYHFCKERDGVGNNWNIADLDIAFEFYQGQNPKVEPNVVKPVEKVEVITVPVITSEMAKPKKVKVKDDNVVKYKSTGSAVEKGSSFKIGKKSYVVTSCIDLHNIQLQDNAGEVKFVCVVPDCQHYSFHEHKVEVDY